MLEILVPGIEYYDEIREEFVTTKTTTLQLEHSLLSLSKWESKWKKAFLGNERKTPQQSIDYIRCMTITKNVPEDVYERLATNQQLVTKINEYIEDSMTATTFRERNSKKNNQVVTSELIYYWMISLDIPLECQKWHLNRLFTLIRICNIKGGGDKKKMSKNDIMRDNMAMNAARRAKLGTKG